ncbi:Nitrate reductase assembly protein NarJ [Commensalibacter communis]|uniref:nitrate reductase molybdenum cofactor assembly chaperone n=1 Tax=Commensalibacter communis TaxID=2972786 RepID=UPI0022FFA364|nr:nitrate reductase molybdenum cofactor assembly chaperone [Commensalibacter communis]CAI3939415.1 Nitrate reductase assembly protein NarJ [Commensalibacter communis]CAI3939465.1 Nitrate reductase assembly protein NarJ [Commensalibacter communis]CAI3940693.1 Nitrate reductase assembly protein NarJ [Commensalibacter communis]CAI3940762.1 Nitrate reductase assembly protein NarJ [Commensalibacter communis]
MQIFKILSVLLCYPEQELVDAVPELKDCLNKLKIDSAFLSPLLTELSEKELLTLQEEYVNLFDRGRNHSLHMFEHIHGEDRIRGQALVDLMNEYQNNGFELSVVDELPDYLPLFLEYLSVCEEKQAIQLLTAAIDVIGHIGKKLQDTNSAYVGIFSLLEQYSTAKPVPLVTPPIRDMDEALEKFGPNIEGIEPLLQPNTCKICPTYDRNKGGSHGLPR